MDSNKDVFIERFFFLKNGQDETQLNIGVPWPQTAKKKVS